MKRTFFGYVCLLAVMGTVTRAENAAVTNPGTNGLTLEALVQSALTNNPEIQFYEAEITVAKLGRQSAGSWANPELNGAVGRKKASDATSGLNAEGVAWSVSLVQPFEWPGRIGLRKAIANSDIELSRLGLKRFQTALAGRVRTLGYELFAAQAKADSTLEVADRFAALREVLVQRDPAGVTPLLESRVIEATEIRMRYEASEAELAAKAALLQMNQLLGGGLDDSIHLTEPRLEFRKAEDLAQLIAAAHTNNFELQVRRAELAQQGFRVALARNERYPAISVGPYYSEETALERERTVGIGISFPLPLWNRNTTAIKTAAARQLQAETSALVAERDVERQVREAAARYEIKLRDLNRWRTDAVEHFREAATLADRHYRLGAVNISTYIELQKQYVEAVQSLLDSKKEALAAAANLELLTGLETPLTVANGQP